MTSQPNAKRADPFSLDVSDFAPTPARAPQAKPQVEAVRAVSEAQGFPSREAPPREKAKPAPPPKAEQRRHRTGRNKQLSLKVTEETSARFTRLADTEKLVLGELLERLLDTYEAARSK